MLSTTLLSTVQDNRYFKYSILRTRTSQYIRFFLAFSSGYTKDQFQYSILKYNQDYFQARKCVYHSYSDKNLFIQISLQKFQNFKCFLIRNNRGSFQNLKHLFKCSWGTTTVYIDIARGRTLHKYLYGNKMAAAMGLLTNESMTICVLILQKKQNGCSCVQYKDLDLWCDGL